MKRQSKFRAKNTAFGTWDFGSMITDNNGQHSIWRNEDVERDGHHLVNYSDRPMFYEQSSFGEFINRVDSNKKEIYELDIVKLLPDGFLSEDYFIIGVVIMSKGVFKIVVLSDYPYKYIDTYVVDFDYAGEHGKLEVIGNFVDNKDLIDEKLVNHINENYI